MSYHGNMKIVETNQTDLHRMIENETHVIRVGATDRDPKDRKGEYERQGYSGTMYVAPTQNMQKAENTLLQKAIENDAGKWNVQQRSNIGDYEGYVYIIQGKRFT